jgi:hypothetical protein
VCTVCHATGAEPAKATALLDELSASCNDIDAVARLLELDGSCIYVIVWVYVIVWAWGVDSLSRLRACLSDVDRNSCTSSATRPSPLRVRVARPRWLSV